jgi:spore coat protein U-like protein
MMDWRQLMRVLGIKTQWNSFKVLFVMTLKIPQTFGEVASSPARAQSNMQIVLHKQSTLPPCFNSSADMEALKKSIMANSQNNFKYNKYRQLLQNSSSEELLARLSYSETLAANCKFQNKAINSAITNVIANRIKIRKGDVKSVLFERNQFSSSLNIYSESQYAEFLCPKNEELWNLSLQNATKTLKETSQSQTVNYFLYKHSPRWKKEPWKLPLDNVLTTPDIKSCVRFFKNPRFK